MDTEYSDEQLAVSRAVRIMLEERWYWYVYFHRICDVY